MTDRYPDLRSFFIPGRQGRLFAALYTAAGERPHPLVIMLHGIPGNERNFDFAQDLRRSGFSVLVFHYSGNWGSDGVYSIASDIDDAFSALDWMLGNADEYGIDPKRISAVGHSLGGAICAHLAASRSEIKAAALLSPCDAGSLPEIDRESPADGEFLRAIFAESAPWLVGTSGDALTRECLRDTAFLNLRRLGKELSVKPVLTLGATRDICTPVGLHLEPLEQAVISAGGTQLQIRRIDSDHFYSDSRIEVSRMLVDFFTANNKK